MRPLYVSCAVPGTRFNILGKVCRPGKQQSLNCVHSLQLKQLQQPVPPQIDVAMITLSIPKLCLYHPNIPSNRGHLFLHSRDSSIKVGYLRLHSHPSCSFACSLSPQIKQPTCQSPLERARGGSGSLRLHPFQGWALVGCCGPINLHGGSRLPTQLLCTSHGGAIPKQSKQKQTSANKATKAHHKNVAMELRAKESSRRPGATGQK